VRRALAAAVLAALLCGCGYHIAGRANLLPENIRAIAVPAFGNATGRYKLADRLRAALTRELISRTRYRIVADPEQADAVFEGALINFAAYPTVTDPQTGRASGVQAIVTVSVTLRQRSSGAVLFTQSSLEVRERYEISTDAATYFEESDTAMDRVARDVARSVVSSLLSSF
jgi:outer membrane lipopolysaccharide assembly protein LptE/RlpB